MVILQMRTLLSAIAPLGLIGSSVNALEPSAVDAGLEEYYAIVDAKYPPPTRDTMLEEYQSLARANRSVDQKHGNPRTVERRTSQWQHNRSRHVGSPQQNTQTAGSLMKSASPSAHHQAASLLAQSAGRGAAPVHGGFGAYAQRSEHDRPNLSVGPLELAITWKTGLESSDNFFHASNDRQDSLSLSAGILANGEWALTEDQSISLSLGAGADYWLDGLDGHAPTGSLDLNIVPGSRISYLISIGDNLELRLYDQLQIQRNRQRNEFSLDQRTLSDQWMNAVGTQLQWSINERLTLDGAYEFGQRRSMEDQYEDNDYDWQTASFQLSLTDQATFAAGIESRASWSDYEHEDRSDCRSKVSSANAV